MDHASTPPALAASQVELEAIAKRLPKGALAWLKRLCDVGFEFVDTVCCRATYRNILVAEGLAESSGGWLCRATQRGHDLRSVLAARKRSELLADCPHPSEDRIAALAAPGAYDCKACGYEHRPSLADVDAALATARSPLQIGMAVQRIGHRHPGCGRIIEIDDMRVRVQWQGKTTWILRSAEGKRWQRVKK